LSGWSEADLVLAEMFARGQPSSVADMAMLQIEWLWLLRHWDCKS